MSWTQKIIFILLSLLFSAMIALLVFLNSKKTIYNGELTIEALTESVDVYFDEFGIPHIYANNADDAYTALGYVHASERLFQMEMIRRVSQGRLSEVLGAELLEVDKLFLTLGLKDHSARSAAKYALEKPDSYQETMAYIDGINSFIAQDKKPIEFDLIGIDLKPFTLEDCFSVTAYMAFSFAVASRTDPHLTKVLNQFDSTYLKALTLNWEPGQFEIPVLDTVISKQAIKSIGSIIDQIPLGLFHGSNGIVLSGERTESGAPMLVNETHIAYSQPAVWYESHMEYPGQSIYGNYLVGFPFAVIGHTDFHSWGITMFEGDDMDFYIEEYKPSNISELAYQGNWYTADTINYNIKIKDAETVQLIRKSSRHGPIVNDVFPEIRQVTSKPVALKWVYLDFLSQNLEACFKIIEARSISEMQEASSLIYSPPLNMMYADIDNNIAWWALSKLPHRPEGQNSKLFLDGTSGKDEYLGYLPFEDNPRNINPEAGVIVTANNQPDTFAGHYHQGYYIPADRYRRLDNLIKKSDKWSVDSIMPVILDHTNPAMLEVRDCLLSSIESLKINRQAKKLIESWDGKHSKNSGATVFWYRWLYHIESMVYKDELGDVLFESWISNHMHKRSYFKFLCSENNPWWDDVDTESIETRDQIIAQAYLKAESEVMSYLGKDPKKWRWSKAHELTHRHALGELPLLNHFFNVGSFQVDGGPETINNQLMVNDSSFMQRINGGSAVRRIIDMAHPDSSWNVLPTGQSGNPTSKHYRDQAELYHNGKWRQQWMCKEVHSSFKRRLSLSPN